MELDAPEDLDISVKTAETHRTNIMRKLDTHSAAELVRYAIRNQFIQPQAVVVTRCNYSGSV